jgi:hypothetical protein
MPLLNFWKNSRDEVLQLSIEQIVTNAGDGNLVDDSEACRELRGFLRLAPSELLFNYARHCLERSFNRSGRVLQDIVNELGRRLDFDVENGRYQGKAGSIGFDGIWRCPEESEVIVESKTTDAYSVSLDTLGAYKEKLVESGKVRRDASELILVGRDDTGALEAQVRGSRYAWEMRLIIIVLKPLPSSFR